MNRYFTTSVILFLLVGVISFGVSYICYVLHYQTAAYVIPLFNLGSMAVVWMFSMPHKPELRQYHVQWIMAGFFAATFFTLATAFFFFSENDPRQVMLQLIQQKDNEITMYTGHIIIPLFVSFIILKIGQLLYQHKSHPRQK